MIRGNTFEYFITADPCIYDVGTCGAWMFVNKIKPCCSGNLGSCWFNQELQETIWWVVFEHGGEMLVEDLIKCFLDEELVRVCLGAFSDRFFLHDNKIYSWRRGLRSRDIACLFDLFGDESHKHMELLK